MENIGDLIIEKRKERGLTQAELGAMLGISGKAVSKWERGLSKPCEEHLDRLVALLGLPDGCDDRRMYMQLGRNDINRFDRGFPRFLGRSFLFWYDGQRVKVNRHP